MDAIIIWLLENYPQIGICIVLIGITAWLTAKAYKYRTKINDSEKKINDLISIKQDVLVIKNFLLLKHEKKTGAMFSMKNSPRRLNDNGERLYGLISGEEVLNNNKNVLFEKIKFRQPKAALDVENYS